MRLLEPEAWEPAFGPWRSAEAVLVEGSGNVGDQLIWAATRQLLTIYGIKYRLYHDKARLPDVVFLSGGGSLGAKYPACVAIRDRVFRWAGHTPVVQLPQSAFSREERPWHRIFLRERTSLAFYPEGVLLPDLAFGYSWMGQACGGQGLGVFLRQDSEAPENIPGRNDPASLCSTPSDYITLAARYDAIITNRLHFAICGLITARPTWLMANNYHKNEAMYDISLKGMGCGWLSTMQEIDGVRQQFAAM